MSLYEERYNRIMAAVALEPVDKVPVVIGGSAIYAQIAGITTQKFLDDPEAQIEAGLKAHKLFGNVDGTQGVLFNPCGMQFGWLSQIKMPGYELRENELWQVFEINAIKDEDYELLPEMGFGPWINMVVDDRIGNIMGRLPAGFAEYREIADQRYKDELGIVNIKDGSSMSGPIEMWCGGRGMAKLFGEDLLDIPEKVERVLKIIHRATMVRYEALFKSEERPFGLWVAAWRGIPSIMNREMFIRYQWQYFREYVQLCVDYGVLPVLHLDGCWDQGLDLLRELPARKCIAALDGKTNILEAKRIAGDRMCIMGDLQAEKVAFSTPGNCYDYCMMLIKEMGDGFILAPGCDLPFNGKLENAQMMAKAADDFAKKR